LARDISIVRAWLEQNRVFQRGKIVNFWEDKKIDS
jgi:hypothetical protein